MSYKDVTKVQTKAFKHWKYHFKCTYMDLDEYRGQPLLEK